MNIQSIPAIADPSNALSPSCANARHPSAPCPRLPRPWTEDPILTPVSISATFGAKTTAYDAMDCRTLAHAAPRRS